MPSYEFFNDVDIKGNVLYNAVAHQATSNPVGKADGFWYYNTSTRRFMFQQDGVFSAFGMTNPMTTSGDMIVGGADEAPGRLGIGTDGQILTMVNGVPAWADPTTTLPLPPATIDGMYAFSIIPTGSAYLDPAYMDYWYPADAVTNGGYRVYRNATKWARAEGTDYHVVSLHATHEDAIAGTNAVYVITDNLGNDTSIQSWDGRVYPAEYGWDPYNTNLCGYVYPPE